MLLGYKGESGQADLLYMSFVEGNGYIDFQDWRDFLLVSVLLNE